MTNSMNNPLDTLIERIGYSSPYAEITRIQDHEVAFDLIERDVHNALAYAKNLGWQQLSMVSCIDWLKDNKFQLVFNVFNWQIGVRVHVRVLIDREDAKFNTVTCIYPGAKYYEREIHEFFGVVFTGNEDSMKPLFLEKWDDIPPYRKDFDSRAYSDKKYVKRTYDKDFGEPGGNPCERI